MKYEDELSTLEIYMCHHQSARIGKYKESQYIKG